MKIPTIASACLLSALTALVLSACPAEQRAEKPLEQATDSHPPADTAPAAADEAGADGKGIGPVKTVEIGTTLDSALVAEGQKTFESKCASCHKFEAKYVGPALKGVTERRKPEWIMNMILNPTEMTQKDPEAKKLFATFMMAMPNQSMDEKSARAVLEYFRSMDQKK